MGCKNVKLARKIQNRHKRHLPNTEQRNKRTLKKKQNMTKKESYLYINSDKNTSYSKQIPQIKKSSFSYSFFAKNVNDSLYKQRNKIHKSLLRTWLKYKLKNEKKLPTHSFLEFRRKLPILSALKNAQTW